MTLSVLRTSDAWWLSLPDGAARIDTAATTTGELLADRAAIEAARTSSELVPTESLNLVSPVTTPCRVLAQMTNFVSHVEDANMDPSTVPLTFFRKTSGSVCGPYDDVIRPAHVTLLDYEIELGLVIGREMPVGSDITAADLPELVAAFVVTNDVSARDVQLPKTQFYEGKSYPTFTPVGPALVILEPGDFDRLADLRLQLWVNGELRQNRTADDMVYSPLEALQALSRFQHMSPGDLILTGTPVGTALSAPAKIVEVIASLLPPATKWRIFFKKQLQNPKYLQDGDLMEATIATDDGAIDLGRQRATVRWAR